MQSADCLTKVSFPFTCALPPTHLISLSLSLALPCVLFLSVFFVPSSPACSPDDMCHMCIRFTTERVMQFLLNCALSVFVVSFEIMHNCTQHRPVVIVFFFYYDCTKFICSISHSPNFNMFFHHQLGKNRVIARIYYYYIFPGRFLSFS